VLLGFVASAGRNGAGLGAVPRTYGINRVVPDRDLREAALAWAQQLSQGPALAHAVTKRLQRHALDQGSRQADQYLLDVAPDPLESRDMQYAVELLLTQGAGRFMQNHAEVVFEGR